MDYFNFIGNKKQCFEMAQSRDNSESNPVFIFKISPRKYGVAYGSNLFFISGFEIVAKITN